MKAVFRAFALPGRMILLAHQKLPRNLAVTIQVLINLPFMLVAMLLGFFLSKKIETPTVTQESLRKVVEDFPGHKVDQQELSDFQKNVDDFIISLQNGSGEKLEVSIASLNSMSLLRKQNFPKSDNPEFFTPSNFYSFQDGAIIEDYMHSLGSPLSLCRRKTILSFVYEGNCIMEHRLTSDMHNFETQEYGDPLEEKKPLESSVLIAIALGYRKLGVEKFVKLARQIKKVEMSKEGITLYS